MFGASTRQLGWYSELKSRPDLADVHCPALVGKGGTHRVGRARVCDLHDGTVRSREECRDSDMVGDNEQLPGNHVHSPDPESFLCTVSVSLDSCEPLSRFNIDQTRHIAF